MNDEIDKQRIAALFPRASKSCMKTRFDSHWTPEPNSGCWLWTANCHPTGYGLTAPMLGQRRAHRVSWVLHRGIIPDGLCVLHKCDTPPCVNPDHLFLGTQKDNRQDAKNKGRIPKGERHHSAKLSNDQAAMIYSDGRKYKEIAKDFGVTKVTVCLIKQGKRRV